MPRNVFDHGFDREEPKEVISFQESVTIPLKSGEKTIGALIVFKDGTVEGDIKVDEFTANLFELVRNGLTIKAEPATEWHGSSSDDIRKRHQT